MSAWLQVVGLLAIAPFRGALIALAGGLRRRGAVRRLVWLGRQGEPAATGDMLLVLAGLQYAPLATLAFLAFHPVLALFVVRAQFPRGARLGRAAARAMLALLRRPALVFHHSNQWRVVFADANARIPRAVGARHLLAELLFHAQVISEGRRGGSPRHEALMRVAISKVAQARLLREAGVPALPIAALATRRGLEDAFAGTPIAALPEGALFVKPDGGQSGKGAFAVGADESREVLQARLLRLARHGPLLVQRRVENHPELAAVVGPTLSTLRVVTSSAGAEVASVIGAFHKLPARGFDVDNVREGAVHGAVDPATGAIIAAWEPVRGEPREVAACTGRPIIGWRLPFGVEAMQLALRGHAALFSGLHLVIGWDVALTVEGPQVVELNVRPGSSGVELGDDGEMDAASMAIIAELLRQLDGR